MKELRLLLTVSPEFILDTPRNIAEGVLGKSAYEAALAEIKNALGPTP